jgi:hypothetical protein
MMCTPLSDSDADIAFSLTLVTLKTSPGCPGVLSASLASPACTLAIPQRSLNSSFAGSQKHLDSPRAIGRHDEDAREINRIA